MNTTRSCPVPGCFGAVKPEHLMCLSCWHLVPSAEQREVHRTFRALRAVAARGKTGLLRAIRYEYQRARHVAILSAERRR